MMDKQPNILECKYVEKTIIKEKEKKQIFSS